MSSLRIGLAQVSSRIGDVEWNLKKHLAVLNEAQSKKVDLLIFPELSLCGYVLRDLAYEVSKASRAAISKLRGASRECTIVLGSVDEVRPGILRNTAFVVGEGKLIARVPKFYLPTYGLFEEARYFEPGDPLRDVRTVNVSGFEIGVSICEDLWHPEPAEALARKGAELIVCIAASPARGIGSGRGRGSRIWIRDAWHAILKATAITNTVHVAFANLVGPEDEEYFWGGSMVVGPDGDVLCEGKLFEEDLVTCDVDIEDNARARRFSSFRVHQRGFHQLLSDL
ncbi:MAG: amidohydrolase [Thaumarchaeota archaeon]|nr:amidohydrolase [Candidatus Calditenuaceae archaeon]MDW8187093.1 nitrilase-related carbon-nitrogen hydrolase [Nitrososphaerota archaeon]